MQLSPTHSQVQVLPTAIDLSEKNLIRIRDLPRNHPDKIAWVNELLFAEPEDTRPIIWDGTMFVGKTTLLQIAHDQMVARGLGALAMRLTEDARYTEESKIVSHDGHSIPCVTINDVHDMYRQVLAYHQRTGSYPDAVLVEEGHFFTQGLAGFYSWLKQENIKGVLTTLSRDFKGDYFRLRVPGSDMKDNILSPETIEDVVSQGVHIKFPGKCAYDLLTEAFDHESEHVCSATAYKIQRMIGDQPAGRFSPVYLIGTSEGCIGRKDATYHDACDDHHKIGPDHVI